VSILLRMPHIALEILLARPALSDDQLENVLLGYFAQGKDPSADFLGGARAILASQAAL
jgi:hypothetical protein